MWKTLSQTNARPGTVRYLGVLPKARRDPRNRQWPNYGRATEGSWWTYRRIYVGHGLYSVQAEHFRDGARTWRHVAFERCEVER
jgi:hypothetical protein